MAKLTAWLVTIIGVWLLLGQGVLNILPASLLSLQPAIIAIAVTVIGVGKLVRNYSYKKK